MSQTLNIAHRQPYAIRVKPITTAPKTPNEPQGRDTFQTPNYATELLIPYIPKNILRIWECAAGYGKIANVLLKNHFYVSQSDIRLVGAVSKVHNFLSDGLGEHQRMWLENRQDFAIITNPPFSVKDDFIEKAFEYKVPFAFLINADYSQQSIEWVRRGCEKLIPTSRIAFITPNVVQRINDAEGTEYESIEQLPQDLLYRYSSAQFHSMWLTYGFGLGKTETFVDLTVEQRKTNI